MGCITHCIKGTARRDGCDHHRLVSILRCRHRSVSLAGNAQKLAQSPHTKYADKMVSGASGDRPGNQLLPVLLQFEFHGRACEHHWLFVCKTVFLFRLCFLQFLLTRQILLTLVKCGCLFDIFRPRLSFVDWFDVHC